MPPTFTRFQQEEWPGPAGQPILVTAPVAATLRAAAPPGTPGPSVPACPPLPANPRAGQPGVNDPYFATSADRDAWIAANPTCEPPPPFQPDTSSGLTPAVPGMPAGYPSNYSPGPVFGDQSDPCAQQFFQFLGANAQFKTPTPPPMPIDSGRVDTNFTNPAAQAISASTGMRCGAWMRMTPAAKRDWVALHRYGSTLYGGSSQVAHLVRQMDLSCPHPARQANMPQPAWVVAAYGAFANANPACATWAAAAQQQHNQYVAQTTPPLPPAPPPLPVTTTGGGSTGVSGPPGPSLGKILLVLGIAGVAIYGLSKMSEQNEPASAPKAEEKQ